MELKLVVKRAIEKETLTPLNVIASKLGYKTPYELWQSIQHMDMFFPDQFLKDGEVKASYDEKSGIIDFHDEDGTLIFYVCL